MYYNFYYYSRKRKFTANFIHYVLVTSLAQVAGRQAMTLSRKYHTHLQCQSFVRAELDTIEQYVTGIHLDKRARSEQR